LGSREECLARGSANEFSIDEVNMTYDRGQIMSRNGTTSEPSDFETDSNRYCDDECSATALTGMIEQTATDKTKYDSKEYRSSFVWIIEPDTYKDLSVHRNHQRFDEAPTYLRQWLTTSLRPYSSWKNVEPAVSRTLPEV